MLTTCCAGEPSGHGADDTGETGRVRRGMRVSELSRRLGAGSVRAVVLVLPGGEAESRRPHLWLAEAFLWPLAGRIARRGRRHGLAVHVLRYRYRGWNGERADPVVDASWALAEVRRRYGPVPVGLVGHSLGGRVAVHVAGDARVAGVVLLGPWLEEADPVGQLRGRSVLIIHGARDRHTDPVMSYRFAVNARRVGARVARVELPRAGHVLLRQWRAWTTLTTDFVGAALIGGRLDPVMLGALEAVGSGGLRVHLPRRRARVLRRHR
ncbi:alpha/beta hydrolase [Pseudonocardia halophobica]|uniref:alpha/beta hydrolase n=1 Tax=Pseudonocardia halophobica TaxID=29401 RepID=UPI003D8AD661